MSDAYARAGVDVDIEAEASRIMYEASKKSFENRKGVLGEIVCPYDDFAGLKMIDVSQLPVDTFASLGFDTAGTKVEVAQRVGKHDTIAHDLFAMVCDDAVMRGGEPVLVGTNLDIKSLGNDEKFLSIMRELAAGYVAAAKEANVAIINGEIAQMGSLVSGWGDFPYHWGAACLWIARKERLLSGKEIRAGDCVVMLRERGFRTNGLTLARTIFQKAYGEAWHEKSFEDSTLGMHVLTPSIIYTRFIIALRGNFDASDVAQVHGISHVTGGGIPEKLGRVLRPSGLGARLDNLFDPPAIVAECERLGEMSDRDAYRAWNMGQGMAIITPEPDTVVQEAKTFGIEAQVAGEIVNDTGITLTSKGTRSHGAVLRF